MHVCHADAEKCVFVWSILSQTPRPTPQLVGFQLDFFTASQRAENLEKTIYQGSLSFHFFERRMADLVTLRPKKSNQCSKKYAEA